MLSSPTYFLCWGDLGGMMKGNSAMMSLTRSPNRIATNHTRFLQPSHWAQIILHRICFRNPCTFPASSLPCIFTVARRGSVQHSPVSYIPPTSYITKTLRRFPPEPFILSLHHRHLSTLFLSLKNILRDPRTLSLPYPTSVLTEYNTLCLQARQYLATWL